MNINQHPSLFPLKTIISLDDSSYCSSEIIEFGTKIICNLGSKIYYKYMYHQHLSALK